MNIRYSANIIGAVFVILCAAPRARADTNTSVTPQAAPAPQAEQRLQVTGGKVQFSIEADHADVQSALKAIFVQAGKQFDLLDNSAAGQLTLKLDNQPLDTVLSSLCKQTFLKYHQDSATHIYHFEQDTDAVKAAFARLDTLNSLLRQQLRNIGLDLPGDVQLDAVLKRSTGSAANQSQNGISNGAEANSQRPNNVSGFGGGGFGGGGGQALGLNRGRDSSAGNIPLKRSDSQEKAVAPGPPASQASDTNRIASKSAEGVAGPSGQTGAAAGERGFKERQLDTGSVPDYLVEQLLQVYGMTANGNPSATVDKAVEGYLRENHLVSINTHGVAVPVSEVLAELSRQSGTAILLDPTVPKGARFRIILSLPACSLSEALNLILPPARLRWRTINNAVFVTPTPEFQIFYGSAPVPYLIYGSNSNSRSLQNQVAPQNQGQGQATGQTGNPK